MSGAPPSQLEARCWSCQSCSGSYGEGLGLGEGVGEGESVGEGSAVGAGVGMGTGMGLGWGIAGSEVSGGMGIGAVFGAFCTGVALGACDSSGAGAGAEEGEGEADAGKGVDGIGGVGASLGEQAAREAAASISARIGFMVALSQTQYNQFLAGSSNIFGTCAHPLEGGASAMAKGALQIDSSGLIYLAR
jgi:hypothetical protein